MTKVLILGASGQIARWVVKMLGEQSDVEQTLLIRDAKKLQGNEPANAKVVIGDVLDKKLLATITKGQDMVYANLAGDVDTQTAHILEAMKKADVKRLVFVLSLGIYDEVPGKFGAWNAAMIDEELKPYRRAAQAIEASGLDYTLLRPAWLTDEDEVDYELTHKGETFKGTVVSRKSVADVVARIVADPTTHVRASLGINKPGTDGDKPYFM